MEKLQLEILVTSYNITYKKGKTEHDDPVPGASHFSIKESEKYGPYYFIKDVKEKLCTLISEKEERGWKEYGSCELDEFSLNKEKSYHIFLKHTESEYEIIYEINKTKVPFNSLPKETKDEINKKSFDDLMYFQYGL
ncbi:MAG: hypothetical protein PHD81_00270 [Candidatus Nanoarchaeia archaeon]|nr:hypothetical protein [Candidatus Nanoarchaeia archaeon]MDD5587526.1 hypothetical protein [Candidatus Nanoarchaeia archaeon]